MRRKLPEDYAIDALVLEVERRKKTRGRDYSYGKLIADTTLEERQEIAEEYRQSFLRGRRRSAGRYKAPDDEKVLERICEKTRGKNE